MTETLEPKPVSLSQVEMIQLVLPHDDDGKKDEKWAEFGIGACAVRLTDLIRR